MSLNTNKDLKMYYSIAEVSRKFGVAGSLLRFWEKEFPNINPKKTERGIRQYTAQDIEEIRIVYNLLNRAYQSHLSRLKYTDINNVTGRQGVYNMGRNVTLKLNIPIQF